MAKKVLIEVLDYQGVWIHYKKISNNPDSIKHALQAALKTPLAANSKTARAVEAKTNIVLKIEYGIGQHRAPKASSATTADNCS